MSLDTALQQQGHDSVKAVEGSETEARVAILRWRGKISDRHGGRATRGAARAHLVLVANVSAEVQQQRHSALVALVGGVQQRRVLALG
jgi:hypothetical protein